MHQRSQHSTHMATSTYSGRLSKIENNRLGSEKFHTDNAPTGSWIEIASRTSSSSLSSVTEDAVVTDCIAPRSRAISRRRRLVLDRNSLLDTGDQQIITSESSQDEYDESESESDQMLTSSTEYARALFDHENERETDSSTTINSIQCFTPQPNAFSYQPSIPCGSGDSVPDSYFPLHRVSSNDSQAQSAPHSYRQTHSSLHAISPSYQASHDAALRASLNTLLSCAAAARGMSKVGKPESPNRPLNYGARVQPSSLRMVPEAFFLDLSASGSECRASSCGSRKPIADRNERSRRRVAKSSSKDDRTFKKAFNTKYEKVPAPTLFTWVMSAGILVFVSAISFSAGFVAGRKSLYWDASLDWGSASEAAKCSKLETWKSELGLRRLKWASASSVVQIRNL